MHFFHKFIIQNELKVLNFIKVYFPKNIEYSLAGGDINKMPLNEKFIIYNRYNYIYEKNRKDYLKVHIVFNAS